MLNSWGSLRAKYELGLYGTPIIVMYCIFELWRTFNYPYKLIINDEKKTLTEIYLMSQNTLTYLSIEKAQVRAGLVFLVALRISVNSIRRFGVIRSLFHLLFRPCQFYLK